MYICTGRERESGGVDPFSCTSTIGRTISSFMNVLICTHSHSHTHHVLVGLPCDSWQTQAVDRPLGVPGLCREVGYQSKPNATRYHRCCRGALRMLPRDAIRNETSRPARPIVGTKRTATVDGQLVPCSRHYCQCCSDWIRDPQRQSLARCRCSRNCSGFHQRRTGLDDERPDQC